MAAPATAREASAVERMSAVAQSRGLRVYGPSSYVVPQADPGTPAWCVSSASHTGAFHVVWLQTVEGVQRLMCSCPARTRRNVVTCSHAQAVRLQLAAQCAARASRPASYVEPTTNAADAPSSEGAKAHGLGNAVAGRSVPFCGWCNRSGARTCGHWQCPYVIQGAIPVARESDEDDPDPAIPADAVESLNAWHAALDAETPDPTPADLGEPDPDEDEDAAHDAIWELQHGPDHDDDDPDSDDDPDPTPPPAAAAALVARVACPSCGALANPEDVRQIGTCLDCVLSQADAAEQQPAPEQPAPTGPESEPEPTRAHCPRCGRLADVDTLAEHGACDRCICARPELSQSSRRTPEQKAYARAHIIATEQRRQDRYRRTGRADDWRRGEAARERDARRRERRESDDNPRADHETAILYRDNRGISPFRETRAPYDTAQPQPDPHAQEIRLMRLGGEFERARQDRDYARAVDLGHEIARIGDSMPDDYAWHLTVLRGRNVIRRARGLEPIHS